MSYLCGKLVAQALVVDQHVLQNTFLQKFGKKFAGSKVFSEKFPIF